MNDIEDLNSISTKKNWLQKKNKVGILHLTHTQKFIK